MSSLSVIIPAYNEELTLASLVQIVLTWDQADEVIVVSDGSTDQTVESIAHFNKQVKIISYKQNKGKGHAVCRGVKVALSENLMFLDADIVAITHKDLNALYQPIKSGKAEMSIGLPRLNKFNGMKVVSTISGQRVVKKKNIITKINRLIKTGYGFEIVLNELHEKKKVVKVKWPNVRVLAKTDRRKLPEALKSFVKEGKDILVQIGKENQKISTPKTKKLFKSLQKYMKQIYADVL